MPPNEFITVTRSRCASCDRIEERPGTHEKPPTGWSWWVVSVGVPHDPDYVRRRPAPVLSGLFCESCTAPMLSAVPQLRDHNAEKIVIAEGAVSAADVERMRQEWKASPIDG